MTISAERFYPGKVNRWISDIRCAIGGALIGLGARITSASAHSHRGDHDWKWQSITRKVKP